MPQEVFNTKQAPANKSNARLRARINQSLRGLGMSNWGFWKSETRYLPQIIHADEELGGCVYGHSDAGSVMLVATDRRVIYLDRKPMFGKIEELTYDIVAGVTWEWTGWSGTLVLHTRMEDIKIRTMNLKAAKAFREYVEKRSIEHKNGGFHNYFYRSPLS